MATFDRHAQYDPIHAMQDAARDTKIADDGATTAMDAQQATVDALVAKITLLQSKIGPYGGATDQDYIDFGQAKIWYKTESAKLPALIDAQAKTKVAKDTADKTWRDAVDATKVNPGQQERS